MAKVLESFDFNRNSGQPSQYRKYLDGRVWEIDCAKDHPGARSPASVLASLYTMSRKMGMKIRSSGVRSGNTLVVQAYKP